MNLNSANLIAYVVFGSIGGAALIYGWKQRSLKPLVIGILLSVYPYFTPHPVALWGIGAVLTLALFFFN